MAYNVKYRITQATQANQNTVVDLLEDGYGGSIINYAATVVNLQYIPQSDDPFEPIYASELLIGIDVTNNAANMPDFTSLDDRKYWVKYYRNGVMKWQGWSLSDNVQYLFSTGFKELRFNAICGLGMLESIDFETATTEYRATIWQFFLDCIRPLNFPTPPEIVDWIAIFGGSMLNRLDDSLATPWVQSYMLVNNFVRPEIDEQGNISNQFSCLDVLRELLTSWGARIMMANGQWNIIQVNQAANSSRYYVRFQGNGTTIDSGVATGFINVPDDAIFLQNTQLKIFKKGYNNFLCNKKIEFPANLLFNANLKQLTSGVPNYWSSFVSGTGYVAVRENQDRGVNAYILALGNNISTGFAQIDSLVPIPISVGYSPKVQFRLYFSSGDTDISGNLHPTCIVKLVATGSQNLFLSNDNTWEVVSLGTNDYYRVDGKKSGTLVNIEEIPPIPMDGTLSFSVYIGGTVTTQSAIIIGEFEVTYESAFKGVKLEAKITDTDTYRKEIVFPHGYNQNRTNITTVTEQPAFYGAITDADGKPIYGWYLQERFGTDNYFSLAELMFQNYINMLRQNLINIDATIEGVIDGNAILTFDDTDPTQINVEGNKYLIGSTSINSVKKELQGTLLQIDSTHQEATVTVTYDNGIGAGIGLKMANNAATSSAAACAFSTYPLDVYSTQFIPVIGDTIYSDADLTVKWQGNGLWWKIFIPYYNTTRSYLINASGVITNSATC